MSRVSDQIIITFFADSHLGFDYPIYPRLHRRRRGDDFFHNYHKILEHAKSKADMLIHGGDVFFRSRVHEKIVDLAYEPLLDVADSGVPVILVPGNHERSELPISLLLSHPNIFVFDKPKTFTFNINGLDVALSGFPFQQGNIRRNFSKVLARINYEQIRADVNLLCIHQAIEGAVVGPANYTFRYGKDTIRRADIPFEFNAVLSGHIHRHQLLLKQNPARERLMPIIYPGSIERTGFAEKYEEKGFIELICNKKGIKKIEFIKVPTRQMIDLNIDQVESIESMKTSIMTAISAFDRDAVVRIKMDSNINEQVKQHINTAFFRSILPETMNFQFTRDL